MFYQLKHITKSVYSADETLFHISIQGARNGCTGPELSSTSSDDEKARSCPLDKCYNTKCLIMDRGRECAGSVLCWLRIKNLYFLNFQQEYAYSSRLKPFCSSLSNSQYIGSQYVLI